MKNLLLFSILLLLIASPLWSSSIKFKAMDKYYDKELPIDSISVYDMNTGEEMLYLTDSIFFETISSVEDIANTNNLQLYPNPVEDILNINLSGIRGAELTISDISGRVHFRTTNLYSGQISLSVAGLPQGVYAIRNGDQSQTFIKNTTSNGQVVSLLSSSSMPSSLVKESKVQSQYDFRFTIYTEGFKPKNYYSKAITKDTNVTLDMSTLTTAFDGKHFRVELYISGLKLDYLNVQHNWHDIKKIVYRDYKTIYLDTLVIRNNKVDLLKNYELRNKRWAEESHDFHKIGFEIDTTNRSISKLEFNYEFEFWDQSGDEFRVNKIYSRIRIDKKMSYNLAKGLNLLVYLDEVNPEYYFKESQFRSYTCAGHTEYWDIMSFIPSKSYIKIEIID